MKRKNYLIIFAILLAIAVWLLVNLLDQQTSIINFRIRIVNIPDNIYIFENETIRVPVTVQGTGINILLFFLSDASIDYNGSDLIMGDNLLDLFRIASSLPYHKNLTFSTIPSDITYVVSTDRILQKRVPVYFDFFSENDRNSFIENQYTFDDVFVTLSGPSFEIQRLENVYTEKISADFLKRRNMNIRLLAISEHVVILPPFIELLKASDVIATRTISFLPIFHDASKMSIFPERVTVIVEGNHELISNLRNEEIFAYVNDSDVDLENNLEIDIYFTVPDFVRIVDYTPKKVDIERK